MCNQLTKTQQSENVSHHSEKVEKIMTNKYNNIKE